jgi:hypothetical protein
MKLCPDFATEVTTIDAGRPSAGVSQDDEEIRNG